MAWQFPQSETDSGVIVDLGTTDDVLVAEGVYLASTDAGVIMGTGSNHEVVIEGIVASTDFATVFIGNSAAADSNNTITIGQSGQIHHRTDGPPTYTVGMMSFESTLINAGRISAPTANGVGFEGNSPGTTSRLINSGTIEAGVNAITAFDNETRELINSGFISGGLRSYWGSNVVDLITNTGQMIGNIDLLGGDDVYNGTAGRFTGAVNGDMGNDRITGGIDNDLFYGGIGNDTLRGNDGNDWLYGGIDNDKLNGNAGNDRLYGDADNDQLYGGASNDQLYGGTENDRLYGSGGNDRLFGEDGNDRLYGGGGNERFYGGVGDDKMYGGGGTDRAYFTGNKGAYTITTKGNKTTVIGPDGTDQLVGVEFLVFDNGTVVV